MDKNKLTKLNVVHYRILPVCGRCRFADFQGKEWATCKKHLYDHQKHTDSVRELSVHFAGSCSRTKNHGGTWFEPVITENLGGFHSFSIDELQDDCTPSS